MSARPQSLARAAHAMMAPGCTAAAQTLSTLLGGVRVDLDLSAVGATENSLPPNRHMTQAGWIISVAVQGAATGQWLVALGEDVAQHLVARLTGLGYEPNDALAQSALLELGNITACAFWGGVARTAVGTFMPALPHLHRGDLDASTRLIAASLQRPLVLTAPFFASEIDLRGTFVLLLESLSAPSIDASAGRGG